jgi:hypothetical protein
MSMLDVHLAPAEMVALGFAFESLCEELGIGNTSLDVSKRERIFHTMLGLIRKGETDVEVLQRRAVLHFTNTSGPAD